MTQKISNKTVAEVISTLIDSLKDKQRVALSVASYLVEERRTSDLDNIMRELRKIRFQKNGIMEVNVKSAFGLDESIAQHVKDLMGGNKAVFNSIIDESLVGGAVFETDEQRLDLSIRSKLNKLKHSGV